MKTHTIHSELLRRRVRVLVVGCGGTGSAVAAGLPYLHQAMIASGHPGGLQVTLMDGDTISPTNCVRQPFSRSETGLHKVVVLVNRLNVFWGVDWEAVPAHLGPHDKIDRADIVIGCVDTRAARAAIQAATSNESDVDYWLDVGNNADSGQFILGEPLNQVNRRKRTRLRSVAELYPAIVDWQLDDDGQPSCSAAEALERQEPFVNQILAQHALALLGRLFRYGTIWYHGGFVSLDSGACAPMRIDPKTWKRIMRSQTLKCQVPCRKKRYSENRHDIGNTANNIKSKVSPCWSLPRFVCQCCASSSAGCGQYPLAGPREATGGIARQKRQSAEHPEMDTYYSLPSAPSVSGDKPRGRGSFRVDHPTATEPADGGQSRKAGQLLMITGC